MNPWCDELLKFYTDMLNGITASHHGPKLTHYLAILCENSQNICLYEAKCITLRHLNFPFHKTKSLILHSQWPVGLSDCVGMFLCTTHLESQIMQGVLWKPACLPASVFHTALFPSKFVFPRCRVYLWRDYSRATLKTGWQTHLIPLI